MPRRSITGKSDQRPVAPQLAGSTAPRTWAVLPGEQAKQQPPADPPQAPTEKKAGPVFVLKNGTAYSRVHPEHILYLQAQGNYVEVHLTGQRVVLRSSLAEVLKALPPGIMVRVNRAQAVNILRLDHVGTGEVRVGDRSFTLSALYRAQLLAWLKVVSDR